MSCLRFQCLRGGPRFALSAVILARLQAMRMGVNTKEVVIDLWNASSAGQEIECLPYLAASNGRQKATTP